MRKLLACLFVLLFTSPMPVVAEEKLVAEEKPYTAGWLSTQCSTNPGYEKRVVYCVMFLQGFFQGVTVGQADTTLQMAAQNNLVSEKGALSSKYSSYCMGDTVNMLEIGSMFVKYMNKQPEKQHEPAYVPLYGMLVKNFPCKKK